MVRRRIKLHCADSGIKMADWIRQVAMPSSRYLFYVKYRTDAGPGQNDILNCKNLFRGENIGASNSLQIKEFFGLRYYLKSNL